MELTTATKPRRRRSPEEATAEIITAAEALLRERPFRELTVDEVMRRTDLSRPSFYVYFRDRAQLVLRVVERIGGELVEATRPWYEEGGAGPAQAREGLARVVEVYRRHGPVMCALADAASHDRDVEIAYGALIGSFVDATARQLEAEIAAGRIAPLEPSETAKALILMTERYLNLALGREPFTAHEVVTETLSTIWLRTLYGLV